VVGRMGDCPGAQCSPAHYAAVTGIMLEWVICPGRFSSPAFFEHLCRTYTTNKQMLLLGLTCMPLPLPFAHTSRDGGR
jgi:hypothetical protein